MTPNMNAQDTSHVRLSENIIIADADYIDYVAFQLSVQFERMLNRRIPPADLSRWAINVALDGGLRPKDGVKQETQVVLVHDKGTAKLDNFVPARYADELNAKAFEDPSLGEFLVNAYAVGDVVSKDDYILETVKTVTEHPAWSFPMAKRVTSTTACAMPCAKWTMTSASRSLPCNPWREATSGKRSWATRS